MSIATVRCTSHLSFGFIIRLHIVVYLREQYMSQVFKICIIAYLSSIFCAVFIAKTGLFVFVLCHLLCKKAKQHAYQLMAEMPCFLPDKVIKIAHELLTIWRVSVVSTDEIAGTEYTNLNLGKFSLTMAKSCWFCIRIGNFQQHLF